MAAVKGKRPVWAAIVALARPGVLVLLGLLSFSAGAFAQANVNRLPGVIDRPGAQAFLEAREAEAILPALLSAVGRAMTGEPPVLLVTQDATETAWWIAAVSYLLDERLARQMTFTTYSHRPGYAGYHLTGTLPGILPADARASFQVVANPT